MAGESFDLINDNNILSLKSPKKFLGGPYKVVSKNLEERWAIVAIDWEGKPRLAMRWFWQNGGNPYSSGNPTWFVIPSSLSISLLEGLNLDNNLLIKIHDFLSGRIKGNEI